MPTKLEELKARPIGPMVAQRPAMTDKHSEITVSHSNVELTINDKIGVTDKGTGARFLEDEGLNPDEWQIVSFRKIEYGQGLESVKFSFLPVKPRASFEFPDLDDLHQAVQRKGTSFLPPGSNHSATVIGDIADPQTGKVDKRGGTEELLERLEVSLAGWTEYVKEREPAEILLVDGGDAIENFENTGAQDRTNDLQLTEQMRVWRRVFWSWIDRASELAPSVKVVSVPSNHCRVRRGKAELGPSHDDFGIEVLAQVADMARVYPERYGHVQFLSPADYEETLAIELIGGKVVGAAHGHQVTNPNNFEKWLGGQALGRTPISAADIFLLHHFHHLRVEELGDGRTLFIAPTSDNGSSWWVHKSGNDSGTGVLSMTVDDAGWYDLAIL